MRHLKGAAYRREGRPAGSCVCVLVAESAFNASCNILVSLGKGLDQLVQLIRNQKPLYSKRCGRERSGRRAEVLLLSEARLGGVATVQPYHWSGLASRSAGRSYAARRSGTRNYTTRNYK